MHHPTSLCLSTSSPSLPSPPKVDAAVALINRLLEPHNKEPNLPISYLPFLSLLPSPPQVDAAVALINRLLQPDDEEMNLHKQLQLRELAALNGTLKDETYCFICGESGESGDESWG